MEKFRNVIDKFSFNEVIEKEQIVIDFIDELDEWYTDESLVSEEIFIKSWLYKVENVLNVMKEGTDRDFLKTLHDDIKNCYSI